MTEETVGAVQKDGTTWAMVPIGALKPSPTNPRKSFDEGRLAELAESVRTRGILQPILIRPLPAGKGMEIVAGERRWRAAKAAGLVEIPAIVRSMTDVEVVEAQLIENLQRDDLHALEEAEGYQNLMAKGKATVPDIAARTGRSVKYVYDRVKLLSLTKDAQKAFLAGKFTAGHAILLARLKPEDQKRAMEEGALFQAERLLWDPNDDKPEESVKPVSVREFEGWIDEHVRFEMESPDPVIFPETALTIHKAWDEKRKIVPITHEHQVRSEARGEGRIFTPRSWKRADGEEGSKSCAFSKTGVVIAGPGRGDAFDVCVSKERCDVHWGKELRAKAKREAQGPSAAEQRAKRQAEDEDKKQAQQEARRARWKKGIPLVLDAVAERVKKAPAGARGLLGDIVLHAVTEYGRPQGPEKLVGRGTTAEDLVRHAAMIVLWREASAYDAMERFPKFARAFGVDVRQILAKAEKA